MTALGKLLRTTAFKLTLVYLTVFALFAAFLLVYFAWNTRRLITEQITQTVDAEITGLAEQYRQGGIRRLVFIVDARSRRPGSSLYLVTAPAGEGLAGNVGSLPSGMGVNSPSGGLGFITSPLNGCFTSPPGAAQINSASPEMGAEMPWPLRFTWPKKAASW